MDAKKCQIQHSLSGINVYVCNNKIIPQRAKKFWEMSDYQQPHFLPLPKYVLGFF